MTTRDPILMFAYRRAVERQLRQTLLKRSAQAWAIPADPFAHEPRPVECPPVGRVSVLPSLSQGERVALGRAAADAVGGRIRLWDSEFRPTAQLHPAIDRAGMFACPGAGCAWCEWAADPRPETLSAWHLPPNPYFLPDERISLR